jgi:hypothetical protein
MIGFQAGATSDALSRKIRSEEGAEGLATNRKQARTEEIQKMLGSASGNPFISQDIHKSPIREMKKKK